MRGCEGILKEFFCLPCLAGRRRRQKSRRGAVGAPLPCIISLNLTVLKATPGVLITCSTLDVAYIAARGLWARRALYGFVSPPLAYCTAAGKQHKAHPRRKDAKVQLGLYKRIRFM